MNKIMTAAAFGAGYVLGAKAGRERYEQLSTKAQELWSHPKVQEQASKVTERTGRVQEQAKDRLKRSKQGDKDLMDDPWAAGSDSAVAGYDGGDVRG